MTVGLESNCQKSEGHLWDSNVEPGDKLILQSCDMAGQQGLQTKLVLRSVLIFCLAFQPMNHSLYQQQ